MWQVTCDWCAAAIIATTLLQEKAVAGNPCNDYAVYSWYNYVITCSATVWSVGSTDAEGGGYDKCMYVAPPGEVDINYKHTHRQLNFSQYNIQEHLLQNYINNQEIRSVELGVCLMQLFHFWSRDVHPVQNLLLCTKFHEYRMIFHWDMAIYRFSKWRPSAILELFYHHPRPPTKSLLLAAAACQILCQCDTEIWRYSYLNFSHIWLEMPIQAPKWGFWGLWTPKCDYSSTKPPKGTSLCKSASFKPSTVKIRWGVWPVGELTESVTDTHTHTHTHTDTHR